MISLGAIGLSQSKPVKGKEKETDIRVVIEPGREASGDQVDKIRKAIAETGVGSIEVVSTESKPDDSGPGSLMIEKLNRIVVPEVELVDTPLGDVLEFLRTRSMELDPEGRGVNMVVLPEVPAKEAITAKFKNAPLAEILPIIARLAGMKVSVTGHAVVLSPERSGLIRGAEELPEPDKKIATLTRRKLETIEIPSIQFVNTPIEDAIAFLRHSAKKLDETQGPNQRHLNLVFQSPNVIAIRKGGVPKKPQMISLILNQIPLGEALQFCAEKSNTRLEIYGSTVLFVPR